MLLKFTIGLPPRTKKNSNRIVKAHGRLMVIPSKEYKDYERDCEKFMPKLDAPIDFPVEVECKFYFADKRRRDLCNCLEAICDVLTHYNVVKDDCYTIIESHDGSRCGVDKEFPRTEVTIRSIEQ